MVCCSKWAGRNEVDTPPVKGCRNGFGTVTFNATLCTYENINIEPAICKVFGLTASTHSDSCSKGLVEYPISHYHSRPTVRGLR